MGPETRRRHIERLQTETFDVLIVGGGINGAGVARDLALRARHGSVPVKIGLVEQRHFASGTSGKNSQLIHGGLRYLKYFEFRLVRESLHERAVLLEMAPHLVEKLEFLIPMYGWRSRLVYGTGLRLYDFLAGDKRLGRRSNLSPAEVAEIEPGLATEGLAGGAVFYDCRVHSARFVLENIADAARHGAVVANYVRAAGMSRETAEAWTVELEDAISGERFATKARKIVDATGPWGGEGSLRLVRGSHIILPRITASSRAIAYFDEQGRIVFFIPWGSRRQLTLVGTTDVDHSTGPDDVRISPEEVDYLVGIVGKVFPSARGAKPISAYSSLRPLLAGDSGSPTAASREHRIWTSPDGILHIAGGKYTTYRAMSEEAADMVTQEIAPSLAAIHETARAPLPSPSEPRIEDLPLAQQVAQAVNQEMAQRLPDLLFVSTYLGYERQWDAASLEPYAVEMGRLLGWSRARIEGDIDLVLRAAAVPGR